MPARMYATAELFMTERAVTVFSARATQALQARIGHQASTCLQSGVREVLVRVVDERAEEDDDGRHQPKEKHHRYLRDQLLALEVVAVNRQKETVERTPSCMRIVMTLRQWAVPWAFLGIEGLVEVTRRSACARSWTT